METPEEIIVVSGLPRSGTSMAMAMLKAGGVPLLTDGARTADEDNPRGYHEYDPVMHTEADASWLPAARGKAVKVVSELLSHLPESYDYRIVFMMRKIEEVLASQTRMMERLGTTDLLGPSDERMEAIFLRHLDRVLAWIGEQPRMQLLVVSYNQVLVKTREHVARIDDFLGGGLDREAMVAVVDPALHRQKAKENGEEG